MVLLPVQAALDMAERKTAPAACIKVTVTFDTKTGDWCDLVKVMPAGSSKSIFIPVSVEFLLARGGYRLSAATCMLSRRFLLHVCVCGVCAFSDFRQQL